LHYANDFFICQEVLDIFNETTGLCDLMLHSAFSRCNFFLRRFFRFSDRRRSSIIHQMIVACWCTSLHEAVSKN